MSREGRRPLTCAAMILTAISFVSTASAQTKQQLDWCVNAGAIYSVDQMIAGCAAAIGSGKQSGHNLAVSFNNRGYAYFRKGNYDIAIPDFDRAIQIEPKFALPHVGRSFSNLYGGALPKALADINQASALEPKNAYFATAGCG